MHIDLERLAELCDAAGVRGRQRRVVDLRAEGHSTPEIAAELGMAEATVYVHMHAARKRLALVEARLDRRELLRFILEEALRGPKRSNPQTGLYRKLPGGGGERVRVSGVRVVIEHDLLRDARMQTPGQTTQNIQERQPSLRNTSTGARGAAEAAARADRVALGTELRLGGVMGRGVDALVKPDLLRWAREEASYSVAEAAQKAGVREDALVEWETGQSRPSIPQLRKLADVYRRSLAVFYLPAPPPRAEPVRDYRRAPGDVAANATPALRFEIRKVTRRREIAIDLCEDLGEVPKELEASASITESPEEVGARVRHLLAATAARQFEWPGDYEAFGGWRQALEDQGVLVFQATGVPLDEMLGFSISKSPFPIVAVNVAHHVRARVFTLMHEFVHLLLREGGVCDLDEDTARAPENRRVEVFCNHAAGAALVPLDTLREHIGNRNPDVQLVSTLARRYHVGREVVARRMLIGNVITADSYQEMRSLFQRDFAPASGSGGPPPHLKALSYSGRRFTSLVLEGYDENRISVNDVTDYLGLRPKYLPLLRDALRKGAGGGEAS